YFLDVFRSSLLLFEDDERRADIAASQSHHWLKRLRPRWLIRVSSCLSCDISPDWTGGSSASSRGLTACRVQGRV
ncbi:hypothetical protein GBF38_013500, partial [Nibea albiflora]